MLAEAWGATPLNYHHRAADGASGRAAAGIAASRSRWIASLPNLISVGRLVLVPMIIMLILDGRWVEAFGLFVVAGLSDAVDGLIAKQWNLQSELGAHLDPLADKALLISIFVALAIAGTIPSWLAILVVFRDLTILAAVLIAVLMGRPMAIRPLPVSKATTMVQIAFAATVLAARAFDMPWGGVVVPAAGLVAALTVASAGAYLARWLDHMGR